MAFRSPESVATCLVTGSARTISIPGTPATSSATSGGEKEDGRVLRAAASLGEVRAVMADDEQGAADPEGAGRRLVHPPTVLGTQVQVEHHDQVVGPFRMVGTQVGLYPADLDGSLLGQATGLGQADVGEVHGGHLPALLGEPHGVASLTRAEV